jgi:hypothetical protein
MEKEFIGYAEALELKELGFNEPCLAWFDVIDYELFIEENEYTKSNQEIVVLAPLYQQAFRWFREKYDLQCWPEPTGSNRYCCKYDGNDETGYRWVGYLRNDNKEILFYLTYEEAELECLKKLIEIVKDK